MSGRISSQEETPHDCTASIAFANCPEGNLDPASKKKIELSWHATAKGKDCGSCVVSVTVFYTNEAGDNTVLVGAGEIIEPKPALPLALKGKAGGGTIAVGTEEAICNLISISSAAEKKEGRPGLDRLCITITIVCTKGRVVTATDADVCCLVCPPK